MRYSSVTNYFRYSLLPLCSRSSPIFLVYFLKCGKISLDTISFVTADSALANTVLLIDLDSVSISRSSPLGGKARKFIKYINYIAIGSK